MISNKSRHAPPKAACMLEALRGFGYTTGTALADIVDNSISASANRIEIIFAWRGPQSTISVIDNGEGMDERELDIAMRLGTKDLANKRSPTDLGRFGVGLKMSSFSQCRRLTVASRKQERLNCLRWDLDTLAASEDDGWYLLEGPAEESHHLLEPLLAKEKGTLVLWENMDRIVTPGYSEQDFLDMIDGVEFHLAMVFHRYLSGNSPQLILTINGHSVRPWDPFLSNQPATWSSPVEYIPSVVGTVKVQCHVLPHKDHLAAPDHDLAAGPNGWTAQQGFYVYRNERLLVAGSWLGLGRGRSWTKEEAYRLARIRLDIPNTADTEWKIDIRKSIARPPVSLKERLTRLAEDTRRRARQVFAHRGASVVSQQNDAIVQAWRTERSSEGVRYRIDEEHPAVKAVIEDAGNLKPSIHAMLRVIEATVPVQRIWLDTTEERETPRAGFSKENVSEVMCLLSKLYENMVLRKGVSPVLARKQLLNAEPFNSYPDLVKALPDLPEQGG